MRSGTAVTGALLLLGSVGIARAQSVPVRPGEEVRLTTAQAPVRQFQGKFISGTGDSVAVEYLDATQSGQFVPRTVSVPRSDVASLEVRTTGHSQVLPGVLIGGAVGLVLGLASSSDNSYYSVSPGQVALGGALWGALIGAFIHTHKWQAVDVGRPSATPMVTTSGTGARVGVNVAF